MTEQPNYYRNTVCFFFHLSFINQNIDHVFNSFSIKINFGNLAIPVLNSEFMKVACIRSGTLYN